MTSDLSLKSIETRVRRVSPSWWSAVAAAAGAGAILVPGHRVMAGAIAGGVMLVLALELGCTTCGAAAQAGERVGLDKTDGASPIGGIMTAPGPSSRPFDPGAILGNTGGCVGCS